MSSFICPVCKEVNEEHRNYCKSCGNWLLSTKFPSIPTQGKHKPKPKWFWIVQLSLISLFAMLALVTILGTGSANNGTYGLSIGLGLLGLISVLICWIIALCIKQGKKLMKQLLLFSVLHIAFIIFGASLSELPQEVQPASVAVDTIPSIEEFKANSITPNPRDLARTADTKYKNKKVYLKGTIVQVVGKNGNELRVNLHEELEPGDFKEPITVYVLRKDSAGTLLNGDEIELWGTVLGNQSYKAWTGVEITVPSVQSHFIALKETKN